MNPALRRHPPLLLLVLAVGLGLAGSTAASLGAGGLPNHPASVPAPELTGKLWLNVPDGTRLSLSSRKGKVTILHFWTYGCINCRRNLPAYDRYYKRFASKGVLVIGVHSPETKAEADPANVDRKVKELGIAYPVLVDSDRQNWNRWQQRAWPAVCLIDKLGRVRYGWEGELEYRGAGGEAKIARLVEALLKE